MYVCVCAILYLKLIYMSNCVFNILSVYIFVFSSLAMSILSCNCYFFLFAISTIFSIALIQFDVHTLLCLYATLGKLPILMK